MYTTKSIWKPLRKIVTLQSKKTNTLFMESQDIKPRVPQDEHIVENVELNIWEAQFLFLLWLAC